MELCNYTNLFYDIVQNDKPYTDLFMAFRGNTRSDITDGREAEGRIVPHGKLNVKIGPPLSSHIVSVSF